MKQLTEATSQFKAIQLELEVLDEKEQARRFEIRDQYAAVEAKLQLSSKERTSSIAVDIDKPSKTGASSVISNPIAIKLPDLRLPTFDGSVEKWSTFYDTFSSTVDQNPSLTDIQKFHYLQSALQGEAPDCLNALLLNNINSTIKSFTGTNHSGPSTRTTRACIYSDTGYSGMPHLPRTTPRLAMRVIQCQNRK